MGDQQHGEVQPVTQRPDQGQDVGGGLGVQRAGRLVAKQHLRVRGQGAGDADALLLPARELRRIGVALALQPDQRQQLPHPRLARRAADPGDGKREGDVLRHRGGGKQVEVLEDHADAAQRLAQPGIVQRQHVAAQHLDPARIRAFQQVDTADQRGLAGAGAADDAIDLARRHIEGDAVQRQRLRPARGEAACQIAEPDGGRCLFL